MNDDIKKLADAIDNAGLTIKFGLEAQGHIPTIEAELARWNDNEFGVDMTYNRDVWVGIGKKIGWEAFSAALAYFEYRNKSKVSSFVGKKFRDLDNRLNHIIDEIYDGNEMCIVSRVWSKRKQRWIRNIVSKDIFNMRVGIGYYSWDNRK